MRLMHGDAAASDGSLSPLLGQPNSGLPEFGHYDWPKSDISDFGREGGGEGQTFSRLNQPLTPALSPLSTGRGSRLSSPPAQMPSDQNVV
jgi:hypothetical protein